MTTRLAVRLLASALILTLPVYAGNAAPPSATTEFARLKTLAGSWRGTRPDGRTLGLTYRLSAGGTVLVETWALGKDRESLTVYHLDKGSLLATHYCPIGNQPRLRLARATATRLDFAFRDATNLDAAKDSHQHAFSLDLTKPNRIVREEVYRQGKADERDTVTFERIANP